jgi:hypothetical protein
MTSPYSPKDENELHINNGIAAVGTVYRRDTSSYPFEHLAD